MHLRCIRSGVTFARGDALTSRTRGASHYRRALRYIPRGVQSGRPKARAGSRRRARSDLNMKWLEAHGPRRIVQLTENDYVNDTTAG